MLESVPYIPTAVARKNFTLIVCWVFKTDIPVILTRYNRPAAVIAPLDFLLVLEALKNKGLYTQYLQEAKIHYSL